MVKWIRYPTYISGFSNPDLAIIHLAQPINIAPATFAAVSAGEVVTAAGFGQYATPSAGLQAYDGSRMGWRAPLFSYNPSNVTGAYFYSTDFDTTNRVPLNGKALAGDSGGPMWNGAGKLVGITVGQFGGLGTIGGSVAQRMDLPEVLSWIEATKLRPDPVLDLKLSTTATTMRLTWDASAIGWTLQKSENLQLWSDLGTTITAAGTYEDPIADRPRYYRLRKP